jgi:hypothetical protein
MEPGSNPYLFALRLRVAFAFNEQFAVGVWLRIRVRHIGA